MGNGTAFQSGSAVTAITLEQNPNTEPGDVLLAQIVVYDPTGTNVPTAPTGWSLVRKDTINAGNHLTSWIYWGHGFLGIHITYTWTISSSFAIGQIGTWRGTTNPQPIDQSSGATAGGSNPITVAAPSLTPFTNGELQVYFYASQNFSAPTITQPGAITPRFNLSSLDEGFAIAYGDLAAPFAGTPSNLYNASSRFPASGTPMGAR